MKSLSGPSSLSIFFFVVKIDFFSMREKRRENEAEGGEVFFFVKQGMIGS